MALDSSIASRPAARTVGAGYLFGVPVGDLGWFATLLMSLASGFGSFFAATFCGIVGLLVYSMATHHTPDYTISYRLIGLPVGLLVLVCASVYLGSLWMRRMLRKA
ncbi:hypothetical protein [Granulicella arctica]|uniref:Uncharacterized protein n=1 Tax=Granulicella arctica TaxID=940613 RepID=A0A7Y9PF31_9BACT|nr:hypothetical protein [Granulicella arctica]NYF78709.1 hypothetical protein [Granulicella arctica]